MTTQFISNIWIEALGTTVLHSLWQGAAIAIVLAILLAFVPKPHARLRYGLAVMGLLAMVIWSGITFFETLSERLSLEASEGLITSGIAMSTESISLSSPIEWVTEVKTTMETHIAWVGTLWIFGVMIFFFRWAGSLVYLQRIRRQSSFSGIDTLRSQMKGIAQKMGLKKSLQIGIMDTLHSPVVIGHFKPLILVPASMMTGLSPRQIDAILAHEIAHVIRHDYLVNMIQSTVEILFFYHPAYWWMGNIIREEREHCCDDMAVAVSGDAFQYAQALTALETLEVPNELAIGLTGRKQYLLGRIKRMLRPDRLETSIPIRLIAILLMVFSMGSIAWFSPPKPISDEGIISPTPIQSLISNDLGGWTPVDTPPPTPPVYPTDPDEIPKPDAVVPSVPAPVEGGAPTVPSPPSGVPDYLNPDEISPEQLRAFEREKESLHRLHEEQARVIEKQNRELEAMHRKMEAIHKQVEKEHLKGELEAMEERQKHFEKQRVEMEMQREKMEEHRTEMDKLHLQLEREQVAKSERIHKLKKELAEKVSKLEKADPQNREKAKKELKLLQEKLEREAAEMKRSLEIRHREMEGQMRDKERAMRELERTQRDQERNRREVERLGIEKARELARREVEMRRKLETIEHERSRRDEAKNKASKQYLYEQGLIKRPNQKVSISLEQNGKIKLNGKRISGKKEQILREHMAKFWGMTFEGSSIQYDKELIEIE